MFIVKTTLVDAEELVSRIDAAMGFPNAQALTWAKIIPHKDETEFYVYYSDSPDDGCAGATSGEISGAIESIPAENVI